MTEPKQPKLGLGALIGLVTGSMIGGGIFSIPQNIAQSAGPGSALIGWAITGIGMLMLAFVFQTLAVRRPDLDAGVYAYAKAGFGDYMGFSSAWGYWISAWLGNVSYFVLLFSALGFFFPAFGNGNTLVAVLCSSILLWSLHAIVLRGIEQAAAINVVATIAKLVPIALFIAITAWAFDGSVFSADIWAGSNPSLGGPLEQMRGTMLVTVFAFIGVEGASVYSSRARRRIDVGRATVIGFLGVLALLMLVNVLSFGILSQEELAALKNPSMAGVLEAVVGRWGATLISVGLVISLLGALLAWTLLCAEIIYAAAVDHTMPAFLRKENANKVPAPALWLTNGLIQLFLLLTLVSEAGYLALVQLATSMILVPYLWSAAFAVLLAWRGETYEAARGERVRDLLRGGIALAYAVWLLYAGGFKYLLLSAILYALGIFFFVPAKRELGRPAFAAFEWPVVAVVIVAALIGLFGLFSEMISL